jgi:hypothetical protein
MIQDESARLTATPGMIDNGVPGAVGYQRLPNYFLAIPLPHERGW